MHLDQKLEVRTQVDDPKSIKNIALTETKSGYEDTFGIEIGVDNLRKSYHSLLLSDYDTDTQHRHTRALAEQAS